MKPTRSGNPNIAMTNSLNSRLVAPLQRALQSGASLPIHEEINASLFELADAVLAMPRQNDVQRVPGCTS